MSLVIERKYKIISRLGKGSFGMIFKGININTNEFVAIKIEKKTNHSTLNNEAKVYNYLDRMTGIPKLRTYGSEGNYNYIVIDLLGDSLTKLKQIHTNIFSMSMIIFLGIQMLQRIEEIHKKGIIHRDIKPDNFIINNKNNKYDKNDNNKLYIIDFGLAKRYIEPNNTHIQMTEVKGIVGTMNYISINVHTGITPSRRDDLESLFYVLYFLIKGKLPWEDINTIDEKERSQQIKREKLNLINKNININKDDKNIPDNLFTYLNYCRQLTFDETPNYKLLQTILTNTLTNT